MSESSSKTDGVYTPDYVIQIPAIYRWLSRPFSNMRNVIGEELAPWRMFLYGLGIFAWYFLTPPMETMATLEPGWIALIWLRNAALLTLVAGGLHWWFYIRRGQDKSYKFNRNWLATKNKKFLWGNQVWDNIFWSIVSGVTIWTLYEAVTLWIYASGRLPFMSVSEHPIYFAFMLWMVFYWSTVHFYFNHRFLHWKPLYNLAHELHHRNVNIGPWTGIAMHPVEHVIYFSVFMLYWFVPVHPAVIVALGMAQGVSPAISHSGFDYLSSKNGKKLSTGDWYHQLHHQYFNLNYGNVTTPIDKLAGTWHDGSPESLQTHMTRMRGKLSANAT